MTILDIYRDHVTAFFNSLMMCTTLLVSLNCKTVNNDITKNDIDHLLLAIRWTFTKQYFINAVKYGVRSVQGMCHPKS